MKYGDRLKELRVKRNLSQKELTDRLNINRSTYARYELNQTQPDFDTLDRFSDFFEVTLDYLLGRSDQPGLTEQEEKKEEYDKLKNIIDSLPEKEREKVWEKVLAYADGLADANKDND